MADQLAMKTNRSKVLYNDDAIYISAIMYDNEPKKFREITKRIYFGVSDHFFTSMVLMMVNKIIVYVSAAGVQMDCIATEDGEDFSWDAIWDSKVSITDLGCRDEIPHVRFSKSESQTWGLNFMREIKRDVQKYTWNYVDNKIEQQ
jgi:hypothetical protein